METTKVKITWKAFGNKPERGRFITSVEVDFPAVVGKVLTDEAICDQVFSQTNRYSGPIWDAIEPLLSQIRTHTALSVGDEVEVDGRAYICSDIGWLKVEDAEIKYLPSEYGEGSIFSVQAKAGVS